MLQADVRAKIVSVFPDCQVCEPAEPWMQPNKATCTVTDELTGRKVHCCRACLEGLADYL